MDEKPNSWETLFRMRHFGLPTRVLDWTESLNMALYFAVYGYGDSPCIWVLDAHKLNEISLSNADIGNPLDPSDGIKDYREYFLSKDNPQDIYKFPFAIIAPRMSDRIFAQRGLFTVQGSSDKMIDELDELKSCFRKIDILDNTTSKEEVKEYLKIMGINHFTVYPDFEGLRMFLMEEYDLN